MTAKPSDSTPRPAHYARLPPRVAAELERGLAQVLPPALYLVATPIGNLSDISLRALTVLARADVIYCEDTRHSRTLLAHYAIDTVLKPYHEHNASSQRAHILDDLAAGRAVALISDAGTPLISDPGFKLVREAAAAQHDIIAIPGASATLTALTAAGLPTDAFFFAGFLPTRDGARQTRIKELVSVPGTLVFFEAPTRIGETLRDLASVLGDRPAAVARELTKLHEDVRRGPLAELADAYSKGDTRGEIVILVGPPGPIAVTDELVAGKLKAALETMSLRDAARVVSEVLGVPKARVYEIGLTLKERGA
ncbi:MAG: 16S rRNA (cytidine(1402)-2'-O)-methyltransferase [Hyphomicrobiaceae bacterium]|jgi:16S rRNA (cytidine1402-2'-O)-methyltransferase|nr:16S rRNA (cytidine(1402)-2'-O)-methyltransferase [Hyphomicrobiaceae bacterium]